MGNANVDFNIYEILIKLFIIKLIIIMRTVDIRIRTVVWKSRIESKEFFLYLLYALANKFKIL